MNTRKPLVLVAPLDWGFGHTTRCIPILRKLVLLNCSIVVACNSKQRLLLEGEIADIRFVHLDGYDIRYGKNRLSTICQLILQIPKILTRINCEHRWLKSFLQTNQIDLLISDNRYGMQSKKIPCVFITHQLHIKTGLGNLIDRRVQKRLYKYINQFTACWVPDWSDPVKNAAGLLSHPQKLPSVPVRYLGCLSRLNRTTNNNNAIDILIILSGPEPQRSVLEKIVLTQLREFRGSGVLIRGILKEDHIPSFDKIEVINFATTDQLNNLLSSAVVVICRAGYTSIMDILKTGKKSILIPTPGQAEQEYLADHIDQNRLGCKATQKNFNLDFSLQKLRACSFNSIDDEMNDYEPVIEELVNSLKGREKFQSESADFGKSKK